MSQPPFDDRRRAVLRALCDTVVPSLPRDHDPDGLWARSATSMGVDVAAEQALLALAPAQRDGLLGLLDALDQQRFAGRSQPSREQTLLNVALLGGGPAAAGVGALVSMILFLAYGMADPSTGLNANWAALGYPGPPTPPAVTPPPRQDLQVTAPEGDELELEADAVVVGSGAGGGVVAGVLAGRGLRVVVLEAGAVPQRGGLHRARAGRLPGPLLARWPDAERRPEHHAHGRRDARRRDDRQLDELPAHPALGARRVGGGRARRRRHGRLRRPPRRRLGAPRRDGRLLGPQRRPAAHARRRRARWAGPTASPPATSTPGATTRPPAATSASATARGPSSSTLRTYLQDAARRTAPGSSRAAPSTACWSARRPRRGRRPARGPTATTGRAPRGSRSAPPASSSPPARWSRRRSCCARGSAARPTGQGLHLHPTGRARRLHRGPPGLVGRAARAARRRVRVRRRREGFGFRIEGTQYATGPRRLCARPSRPRPHTRRRWSDFRTGGTFLGLHPRPRRTAASRRRRRPGRP